MSPRYSLDSNRPLLSAPRLLVAAVFAAVGLFVASAALPAERINLVIAAGFGVTLILLVWVAGHLKSASERHLQLLKQLHVPLALAGRGELYQRYCDFASGLQQLTEQSDPVLLEFAKLKLTSLAEEVQALAQGRVIFHHTETWRTVYQRLLETLNVRVYYSVAWVRTSDYWQDPPARQSMLLNFSLVERGYRIERILILPDELWQFEEESPAPSIQPWIDEQHRNGVVISLVREHELAGEPDLLGDFGIYGQRAVGCQELDERARTLRFVLEFGSQTRREAHQRWERLQLYAKNYENFLDITS